MNSAILFYLVVVNLYVFFLMWLDRYQEKTGKKDWPVSEWQMMIFGLCAGGLGGLLAISVLDYKKDRKRLLVIYSLGGILAIILFAAAQGWI